MDVTEMVHQNGFFSAKWAPLFTQFETEKDHKRFFPFSGTFLDDFHPTSKLSSQLQILCTCCENLHAVRKDILDFTFEA